MIEEILLALVILAQVTVVTPSPPTQLHLDPVCIYDEPGALYDSHCVYQ